MAQKLTKSERERFLKIFEGLPKINCKKRCQSFCCNIPMLQTEAMLAVEHLKGKVKFSANILLCPLLKSNGDCSIYPVRPGICRLWGLTKDMACPYGCIPERWLDNSECHAVLDDMVEFDKEIKAKYGEFILPGKSSV